MPRTSVFDAMPPEHRPLVFSCQAYRWFRGAAASTGLPLCPDWNPEPDYGRGFAHFIRDLRIPWDQVAVSRYTFEIAPGAAQLDLHTVTATLKGSRLSERRASSQERMKKTAQYMLRSFRDRGSGREIADLLVLYSYILSRTTERPEDAEDHLGAPLTFSMRRDGTTRLPFLNIPESNLFVPLTHSLNTLGKHTPGSFSVNGIVALAAGGRHEQSLVETYQPAEKKRETLNIRASPLHLDITPIGFQLPYCMSDGTIRRECQQELANKIHNLEDRLKAYADTPDVDADAELDADADSDTAAKAKLQQQLQALNTEFHERQLKAQSWIRTATGQLEWLRRDSLLLQGVDPNDQFKNYPLVTNPDSIVARRLLTPGTGPKGPRTEFGIERKKRALERQRQRDQAEEEKKVRRLKNQAKRNQGFKEVMFRQFCLIPQTQLAFAPVARGPRLAFFVHPDTLHAQLQKAYATRSYLSVEERCVRAPKGSAAASTDSVDLAAAACTEMLRDLETGDDFGPVRFLPDHSDTITVDRNDHPWSTAAQERWKLYTAWVRKRQQECTTTQERTTVRIWPPPIEICTHKTESYEQILLPRPLVFPKLILDWNYQKDQTDSTPEFDLLQQFGELARFWLLVDGPWNGAQVPRLLFKRIETYLSIDATGRRC